ncbi:hypothetical protein [Comamonas testosteroni]|uniref:hypothetical protein n=1 Tax=Comamonas testosteroni TaxID=285 RepID=UPI0011ECA5AB|nr:hypothetical protein [Comamonas testosteroni]
MTYKFPKNKYRGTFVGLFGVFGCLITWYFSSETSIPENKSLLLFAVIAIVGYVLNIYDFFVYPRIKK